eukprot:UN17629
MSLGWRGLQRGWRRRPSSSGLQTCRWRPAAHQCCRLLSWCNSTPQRRTPSTHRPPPGSWSWEQGYRIPPSAPATRRCDRGRSSPGSRYRSSREAYRDLLLFEACSGGSGGGEGAGRRRCGGDG